MNTPKPKWDGSEVILDQLMEIARVSALAEISSGIAHELNQPLGAIATFAQAGERMLNRPQPMVDSASDVFRQINQEALGAGEGIQRIRRLFELQPPTRSRFQMSDLIAQLWPLLEILVRRVNGSLRLDAPATLPDVQADRLRIQHALFVLVQNAVDASAQDPDRPNIVVDISADRYAVETGVTDCGIGVAVEIKDRLFRPFFTTKPDGTGLGLASSRAIIESHEGTIGFDNVPSGGSRFWFRLPVADNQRNAHDEIE